MKRTLLILFTTGIFSSCNFFSQSDSISLIPFVDKENKSGYLDQEGKIAITPQFAEATVFRDGLALVQMMGLEGKWGYIDKTGKIVIKPIYQSATPFGDGLAWVTKENSPPMAITKDGSLKFKFPSAYQVHVFSERLAGYYVEGDGPGRFGFVDVNGEIAIKPQFVSGQSFHSGLCAVEGKNKKWGYIDPTGKNITGFRFDLADDFVGDLAMVMVNGKAGIINKSGAYLISPKYDKIILLKNRFLFTENNKTGWCDLKGNIIVNAEFDEVGASDNSDIMTVMMSGKWGLADHEGKILVNPQFDGCTSFIGKVAFVKSGGKLGMIDQKGSYILQPKEGFEPADDLFAYLFKGVDFFNREHSISGWIRTDYLDLDKIISVVNFEKPEGCTFSDTYGTILSRFKIQPLHLEKHFPTLLYEKKQVTNAAAYGVAMITEDENIDIKQAKPDAFAYYFTLSWINSKKAETVVKAFEKKLAQYRLLSRGYDGKKYTSIFEGKSNRVILSCDREDRVIVMILNLKTPIQKYLQSLSSSIQEDSVDIDLSEDSVAVDTTGYN